MLKELQTIQHDWSYSPVGSLGNWDSTHVNVLPQKKSQTNSLASKQEQWICVSFEYLEFNFFK